VGCSFWREDGSVVYNCCWSLPAQSLPGPSPMGLATIFYCLRFETSLTVASYDSQGYGGAIRPRLHTGSMWKISHCSLYRLARIHWNQRKLFVVTKTCLLKRRLLSNRGSTLDCVTSRKCLPKRCLAMYCFSLSRKRVFTIRCQAMIIPSLYSLLMSGTHTNVNIIRDVTVRCFPLYRRTTSPHSVQIKTNRTSITRCSVASIQGCKTVNV
jgi:hypothetical protein